MNRVLVRQITPYTVRARRPKFSKVSNLIEFDVDVSGCGCKNTTNYLKSKLLNADQPETPNGWRIHFWQEDFFYLPELRRNGLTTEADIIFNEHEYYRSLLDQNLPLDKAEMDRHAKYEEDALAKLVQVKAKKSQFAYVSGLVSVGAAQSYDEIKKEMSAYAAARKDKYEKEKADARKDYDKYVSAFASVLPPQYAMYAKGVAELGWQVWNGISNLYHGDDQFEEMQERTARWTPVLVAHGMIPHPFIKGAIPGLWAEGSSSESPISHTLFIESEVRGLGKLPQKKQDNLKETMDWLIKFQDNPEVTKLIQGGAVLGLMGSDLDTGAPDKRTVCPNYKGAILLGTLHGLATGKSLEASEKRGYEAMKNAWKEFGLSESCSNVYGSDLPGIWSKVVDKVRGESPIIDKPLMLPSGPLPKGNSASSVIVPVAAAGLGLGLLLLILL